MKLKGGYMGKILRIDLSSRDYTVESIKEQDILKLLGGRGLAAKIYYDEIAPDVGPYDPENKIPAEHEIPGNRYVPVLKQRGGIRTGTEKVRF